MTVQTIKITKKQRAVLEHLVRLNENITFRFNNRPSNVAFETDETTIILSELESIKAILTPSQYAKLRMMFDDTFTYTPRTRRTAVATPVATPVVEVAPVIIEEPVIEAPIQEVKLSETVNLNAVRGNLHRDAINLMTQAEFDSLETTKMAKRLGQEPDLSDVIIVKEQVKEEPVKYAVQTKVEQSINSFEKYRVEETDYVLAEMLHNETVDGFTLQYRNSFKKSMVQGLSGEPKKVYVEDDQYKSWQAFRKEKQEKARREAMMW